MGQGLKACYLPCYVLHDPHLSGMTDPTEALEQEVAEGNEVMREGPAEHSSLGMGEAGCRPEEEPSPWSLAAVEAVLGFHTFDNVETAKHCPLLGYLCMIFRAFLRTDRPQALQDPFCPLQPSLSCSHPARYRVA